MFCSTVQKDSQEDIMNLMPKKSAIEITFFAEPPSVELTLLATSLLSMTLLIKKNKSGKRESVSLLS